MRIAAAALVLACACHGDPEPTEVPEFPPVAELPQVAEPPDPFTTFTGQAITTPEEWFAIRKPELERLFGYYVYGFAPEDPGNTTVQELTRATIDEMTSAGTPVTVDYREYEIAYGPPGTPPIFLAVFAPVSASEPLPVFLVLNACGNQSATDAPQVRQTTSWQENACNGVRGEHSGKFPVGDVTAAGYAMATFHQSDVDPDDFDDKVHGDGVHPHFTVAAPLEVRWGTLRAWAFGMSRAIDALVTLPHIDAARIATVGHSRRGKVALMTAAFDDRVSIAIPHQSGTGGATLTRSDLGEPVAAINLFFPHWFDDVYKGFSDNEHALPIDQHLLIAMVAPRPVLVTNGAADSWADPPGAMAAVELAHPVYELLGATGMQKTGAEMFDFSGDLAWHVRPGPHSLEPQDWATFMAFAAQHW